MTRSELNQSFYRIFRYWGRIGINLLQGCLRGHGPLSWKTGQIQSILEDPRFLRWREADAITNRSIFMDVIFYLDNVLQITKILLSKYEGLALRRKQRRSAGLLGGADSEEPEQYTTSAKRKTSRGGPRPGGEEAGGPNDFLVSNDFEEHRGRRGRRRPSHDGPPPGDSGDEDLRSAGGALPSSRHSSKGSEGGKNLPWAPLPTRLMESLKQHGSSRNPAGEVVVAPRGSEQMSAYNPLLGGRDGATRKKPKKAKSAGDARFWWRGGSSPEVESPGVSTRGGAGAIAGASSSSGRGGGESGGGSSVPLGKSSAVPGHTTTSSRTAPTTPVAVGAGAPSVRAEALSRRLQMDFDELQREEKGVHQEQERAARVESESSTRGLPPAGAPAGTEQEDSLPPPPTIGGSLSSEVKLHEEERKEPTESEQESRLCSRSGPVSRETMAASSLPPLLRRGAGRVLEEQSHLSRRGGVDHPLRGRRLLVVRGAEVAEVRAGGELLVHSPFRPCVRSFVASRLSRQRGWGPGAAGAKEICDRARAAGFYGQRR